MKVSALYRTTLLAVAALASGLLLGFERPTGQEIVWQQSFPADALAAFGVDTLSGAIAVEAWDRPEVAAQAILGAGLPPGPEARRRLEMTQIVPRLDGPGLRLEVVAPPPASDSVSADFTVRVPRGLAQELRTGSGSISVTGVWAPLRLTAGSGSIAVNGSPGPMTVETAS